MLPRMQSLEIGHAIVAQDHRLTVDHEEWGAQPPSRLADQRIPVGPVIAASGEQPYPRVVAPDD
jgi:hypothetical protein